MSTIKVDTIATRTGSGNITLSNSLASATVAGALTVDTSATVAGDLTVDTNTLKVDASSNTVGIRNTSSNALQAVNGRPGLVVGDTSGARGIAILTSATGAGSLLFANATSGAGAYRGYIEYDHNGNTLNTYINSSVHAQRIHSDGVISIPQGIELGSGVDKTVANTLDDYEEGTFVPIITGTSGGTATGNSGAGSGASYTKIGNTVFYRGYFANPSISGTLSGSLRLALPFTNANNNEYDNGAGGFIVGQREISSGTTSNDITLKTNRNENFARLRRKYTMNNRTEDADLTQGNASINTSTLIWFQGIIKV